MMEHPDYRRVLEDILTFSSEHCGGRRLLTVKDVCDYTGRSRQYVTKTFKVDRTGIMATVLAQRIVRMGGGR